VKTDQAHPFLEPQIPSLLHAWNVHGTDQPLSTTQAIVHDTVPLPTKTDQAFEFEHAHPMTVLLSLLTMTVISLGPRLKYPLPHIVGHARSLPHSHQESLPATFSVVAASQTTASMTHAVGPSKI
jgi:hypothetical protein